LERFDKAEPRRLGSVDANMPSPMRLASQSRVNSIGQRDGVRGILRGGHNAAVRHPLAVQPLEMPAVVCQHGSAKRVRAGQNVRVGSAVLIVLVRGQDVMSKPAQFLDH
jgi:hypothetical protein